jgi:hypothetical protein
MAKQKNTIFSLRRRASLRRCEKFSEWPIKKINYLCELDAFEILDDFIPICLLDVDIFMGALCLCG